MSLSCISRGVVLVVVLAGAAVAGCAGRPALTPNRDKALRRTSAEFAADAAKRHPYKADAPRGGEAIGRAHLGYALDRIDVVNFSDEDWTDVEVWVNQKYVVFLPKMERKILKTLNFQMLFDDAGRSFPTDNRKTFVEKVEFYRNGKMYDVKIGRLD